MTKNNKRLCIFFILLLFFLLPIIFKVQISCPFKKIFHLSCPGCGLTRSIFSLLHFQILDSLYYNILGIPLFITLIISYSLVVIDIIKKENYLQTFWNYITKHYKVLIFLLIITFILNNIHKI